MDREKVIKGLEVCRDQDNPPGYRFTGCKDDCPYYGNGCAKKLKEDAMDQLKEQPEIVRCKDCWKREFDNCPFNEFSEFYKPDDDFFCADGERRAKNDG
jgi:hypothetical protein